MEHLVTFKVPASELGKTDIEFVVKQNREKFGTLRVSKGALVWYPRNGVKGRKVTWTAFDDFMRKKPKRERRRKAKNGD